MPLNHIGAALVTVEWCVHDVVNRLYRQLTVIVDEPEKVYPTASAIWSRFQSVFESTFGLLQYAPVFKSYFYQALQQFYDDGVQYMELRSLFLPVHQ